MTPERINELVSQIDDFGGDPIVARKAIITAINETKEEDAEIARNIPYVCLDPNKPEYTCQDAASEMILASKIKE